MTWLSKSGDTTMWSWIITVMYVLAIILSFYLARTIKAENDRHFLWVWLSVFLLAMGLNKQLDVQILISMTGKYLAWNLNIYQYGRLLQKILALGILLGTAAFAILIFQKTRSILHKEKLSLTGFAILILFTLIRVGSISHIGIAIYLQYYVISRIHGLEFLGLLVITISLIRNLYLHKKGLSSEEDSPKQHLSQI